MLPLQVPMQPLLRVPLQVPMQQLLRVRLRFPMQQLLRVRLRFPMQQLLQVRRLHQLRHLPLPLHLPPQKSHRLLVQQLLQPPLSLLCNLRTPTSAWRVRPRTGEFLHWLCQKQMPWHSLFHLKHQKAFGKKPHAPQAHLGCRL